MNYSGLVIAGLGFFLTRFTVTLALYEDPVRFFFAGVVPLVLGLGLAAFGVALTVADVERSLVRTTATWCVIGAGTMFVLVVLTLLGSASPDLSDPATVLSRTYLSNFLIGGSVGGTLTGLYAARNRRQRRTLYQQANRLEVLNRLLRHEILNSLTAIRGYAALSAEGNREAQGIIERRSDAIAETVEQVKYLARSTLTDDSWGTPVALDDCIEASLETVRETHPDASISVESGAADVAVLANDRLEQALTHLLENAVVHSSSATPTARVTVDATARTARVSVHDDGPGLPEAQRRLLEDGVITEFDDPRDGYGLNVVRLLVESYRGDIETDVGPNGTTVTLVLPLAAARDSTPRSNPTGLTGVRPALPQLLVTLAAALAAGVVYGLVSEQFGGSVSVIGVFYGVDNWVVGWVTHEFHSVVFGFVFAGLVSLVPSRHRTDLRVSVAVGAAWSVVLWFVAAGIISALWLQLLGIPASLPSLSLPLLVSHLAWGVSLGILSALGYEHVSPRLAELGERLRSGRRSAA